MYVEEIPPDECRQILKQSYLGRVACSRNDHPYIVPFYYAYDESESLFAFSTVGQKIRWMRENPNVCVEVDDVRAHDSWQTLIVFGQFEELPDEPKYDGMRRRAHELLSKRPMWWKPAYVAGLHDEYTDEGPVYFRIRIDSITGHRSAGEQIESVIPPPRSDHAPRNWLRSFRL